MKLRIAGTNLRGKDIEVTLDVISKSDNRHHNTVVRWTDGKPAAYSGLKIWRSTCYRFTTMLKDVTEAEFIY